MTPDVCWLPSQATHLGGLSLIGLVFAHLLFGTHGEDSHDQSRCPHLHREARGAQGTDVIAELGAEQAQGLVLQ